MNHENKSESVIIIGAGFAGLGAGIYAQMNGFKTRVFELHDKPGGLCTAWKRKGYTIDGCIHWLVGSSPKSGIHDMWEEVGVAQGLQIINPDEYCRFEDTDGRKLIFFTNIDKLEKHLLELSPQDAGPIKDFIRGIKLMAPIDQPSAKLPGIQRMKTGLKVLWTFMAKGAIFKQWLNTSAEEFSLRFKDPLLREAIREMWFPEFSMFFMLFTFAYMHNKNAGYPLGGSVPMSNALEARYKQLGGKIFYNHKVEKILTRNGKAIGVRLANGEEHFAEKVISAADGYATIFNMLDGHFGNEETFKPFKEWKIFPPLVYVGLGVNRTFENEPLSVSGICFKLARPVIIAGIERNWLPVRLFNHDPSMAPSGKTSIAIMLPSSYDYWKTLGKDAYLLEKQKVANLIIDLLEQRFPGISSQVEMTDVSTPLTFERYTGNWQGSFEGWMITPENSRVLMKKMPQQLPGLKNFYMCGQWVEPGGGLPTGIISGKRLVKAMCKADGKNSGSFHKSLIAHIKKNKKNPALKSDRKVVRSILGVLLAFLALNAFGGGIYGLLGAEGLPPELLEGSPFKTYFTPSLILFTVVGGSFLFAAIAVFTQWKHDRNAAFFAALVVLIWIAVQLAIIGFVSWLQPGIAIAAIIIIALAWYLPVKQSPKT